MRKGIKRAVRGKCVQTRKRSSYGNKRTPKKKKETRKQARRKKGRRRKK